MILAISLSGVSPWRCPILAQSGWRDHPVGHSGVPFGLVRRSLGLLLWGLSYVALSLDGAPGEGCLTEAWPGASGHDRWRNGVVRRGNHHYGEGWQRLQTPPPVVSRGLRERRCPLVREACWLGSWRKIGRTGALGLARRLSWPVRLSGAAAPLERTSQAASLALTRGARSGGCHVSGRSGSRTRSLSGEGNSPRVLTGRPVLGPVNLPGLALYKSGPLGTPGLFSRHISSTDGNRIRV